MIVSHDPDFLDLVCTATWRSIFDPYDLRSRKKKSFESEGNSLSMTKILWKFPAFSEDVVHFSPSSQKGRDGIRMSSPNNFTKFFHTYC